MTATPDRHDRESLRVSYCGFHVGYARSVPELEGWIELAQLEEALTQVRCWRRDAKAAVSRSCGWVVPDRPAALCAAPDRAMAAAPSCRASWRALARHPRHVGVMV